MKNILQMQPWFGVEEQKAMNDYLGQGGWITEFKKTEEFESQIKEFVNAKHVIAVNNGTISLTLAAAAIGIEAGDEVIVPNFTMIATPNSFRLIGAHPVFVDVEESTLCMDFSKMKDAITGKTKAIVLVSANGRFPKEGVDKFVQFAHNNNLVLIEDSAQALGSRYPDGTHIGRKGLVGSFSFSAPKIISTGQGGALITDSDELAHKIRKFKDFGREEGGVDIHDTFGVNFKFTDIQAVIGIEQMKKLQWRVDRKKEIYKRYRDNLSSITKIKFFNQNLEYTTPWFIDILVERRDELQLFLKENGIGTRVMYPPINRQIVYNVQGEHPVSNIVGEKGLWLPSSAQLTNEEIDYVTDCIKDYFAK